MKQYLYTAVVILGLVIQPLAVVSATHNALNNDSIGLDLQQDNELTLVESMSKPCHENVQTFDKCCDTKCGTANHCSTVCTTGSLAAIQASEFVLITPRTRSTSKIDLFYNHNDGPPSIIFHPPIFNHLF